MKIRLVLVACVSLLACSATFAAQSEGKKSDKKQKAATPADAAYSEFQAAMRERAASLDQAKFGKVIAAGLKFLTEFPSDRRAPEVSFNVVAWSISNTDPKQRALRSAYLSQLRYDLLLAKGKDGLSDEAKLALSAVDVSIAGLELTNKASIRDWREALDAFAATPGAGPYLPDRERQYARMIGQFAGPDATEKHYTSLLQHNEKMVAGMAREELELINLKKTPFAAKAATLDGKEVDFDQLRGKTVAVFFWQTNTRNVAKIFESLEQISAEHKKKGFEIVTVTFDREADREKLTKFIKENRVRFPVVFDGKGNKTELAEKLNVSKAGTFALFDKNGILLWNDLGERDIEGAVKQVLNAKK